MATGRYHINSKTGRTGRCKAQEGNCPLGGDTPHFATKEEAQEALAAQEAAKHAVLPTGVRKEKPQEAPPALEERDRVVTSFMKEGEKHLKSGDSERRALGRAYVDAAAYLHTLEEGGLPKAEESLRKRAEALYDEGRSAEGGVYDRAADAVLLQKNILRDGPAPAPRERVLDAMAQEAERLKATDKKASGAYAKASLLLAASEDPKALREAKVVLMKQASKALAQGGSSQEAKAYLDAVNHANTLLLQEHNVGPREAALEGLSAMRSLRSSEGLMALARKHHTMKEQEQEEASMAFAAGNFSQWHQAYRTSLSHDEVVERAQRRRKQLEGTSNHLEDESLKTYWGRRLKTMDKMEKTMDPALSTLHKGRMTYAVEQSRKGDPATLDEMRERLREAREDIRTAGANASRARRARNLGVVDHFEGRMEEARHHAMLLENEVQRREHQETLQKAEASWESKARRIASHRTVTPQERGRAEGYMEAANLIRQGGQGTPSTLTSTLFERASDEGVILAQASMAGNAEEEARTRGLREGYLEAARDLEKTIFGA